VGTITIEGRDGKTAPPFEGELLVPEVSTYSDDKARWVEFRLYRKDEGGFVVHRTGKSLIYHKANTRCAIRSGDQPGQPTPVQDLPEDAEPCERCKPPWADQLPGAFIVRFEGDRNTITHVKTAAEAVRVLTWDARAQMEIWSEPVSRLLMAAAGADDEFAKVPMNPTIKL
jgi:hypothetical protein